MPRPSLSSRLNQPDNIGGTVQIFKLIIMQFSPRPIVFSPRPKYPPQHPVLKHLQSVFLHTSKKANLITGYSGSCHALKCRGIANVGLDLKRTFKRKEVWSVTRDQGR
ncbi:hypothetical protein L798_11160 [Zootermopsis nevadensis]|uniref:Uncharacterized protein n=1 Tax=Zootermopsis nevadensis TaxID=136037 RepID=A0A067RSA2_ZOONE|nr:hypothetical protein L798_11160 [Zootermopsis nevadensis]